MTDPFDALAAETRRTGDLLRRLSAADWDRPTRCAPLDVREIVAHALRGSSRLLHLAQEPTEGEAETDAVQYFRYDPVAEGPMIAQRAQEAAEGRTGEDLARDWSTQWPKAVEAARAVLPPAMIVNPVAPERMLLSEYVKTRVLEVTVHSMDVRDALGLAPDPTKEGLDVTCAILRGLLGADLRPHGVDEVRFVLTGTGRESIDDSEREILGPLADLYPLLA
ncbi:MAG: hypothetical protein NVSMB57_14710 [Actinomycetota bacterium]